MLYQLSYAGLGSFSTIYSDRRKCCLLLGTCVGPDFSDLVNCIDRSSLAFVSGVSIPHCCVNVGVPHHRCHSTQRNSGIGCPGSECVAKVVSLKISLTRRPV